MIGTAMALTYPRIRNQHYPEKCLEVLVEKGINGFWGQGTLGQLQELPKSLGAAVVSTEATRMDAGKVTRIPMDTVALKM